MTSLGHVKCTNMFSDKYKKIGEVIRTEKNSNNEKILVVKFKSDIRKIHPKFLDMVK